MSEFLVLTTFFWYDALEQLCLRAGVKTMSSGRLYKTASELMQAKGIRPRVRADELDPGLIFLGYNGQGHVVYDEPSSGSRPALPERKVCGVMFLGTEDVEGVIADLAAIVDSELPDIEVATTEERSVAMGYLKQGNACVAVLGKGSTLGPWAQFAGDKHKSVFVYETEGGYTGRNLVREKTVYDADGLVRALRKNLE